jgi:glutamine synthetase
MKRVAARHGFLCLFHEKPFAAINGSGKHCNWAIANDKGENLLEPGHTPHQNLRFLAMVAITIAAVHRHAGVLAASIMSPGNDHRLGGNEAPPTIISIYLGSMLEQILDHIERGEAAKATEAQIINLGVNHLPDVSKDYTDRNRTSPFAFTGNKFEFRAVGASANVATPVAILNAAVADTFVDATKRLKSLLDSKMPRDEAVMTLIRELVKEAKAVLFSGNGYSAEWRAEANRRGLPIVDGCAHALELLGHETATAFLSRTKTLSQEEIMSRRNVAMERFVKTNEIEIETTIELISEYVVPAVEKQLTLTYGVASNAKSKALVDRVKARVDVLEGHLTDLLSLNEKLKELSQRVHGLDDERAKVDLLAKEAIPTCAKLRKTADAAEVEVADELWTLPKYRELLFHPSLMR